MQALTFILGFFLLVLAKAPLSLVSIAQLKIVLGRHQPAQAMEKQNLKLELAQLLTRSIHLPA